MTVGGQSRHVIGYMKDFLFGPEQASTPVGVLSGGERGRLTLARAFARPSNLLVLDEPTNDLDLETLDLLQERLAEYPGTVLLVSHDRDFLDRVVTSVIASEGDGRWIEYAGGYSDMLAQRAAARAQFAAAKGSSCSNNPSLLPHSGQIISRPYAPNEFQRPACAGMLPARIAALEMQIAGLNAVLADPDLYARDPARFGCYDRGARVGPRRTGGAEEQWLTTGNAARGDRSARTTVLMRQPRSGDPLDDLSAGTPCHAKRVLAQPVSNGTLISGSDRL